MSELNPLYGKIFLKGVMTCETGLHIGSATGALEIGGIDAAVVKDPLTSEPYVPGSSLKGKMRSLMERKVMQEIAEGGKEDAKKFLTRVGGNEEKPIRIHVCTKKDCQICRLFGSTPMDAKGENIPSPLIVSDLSLRNGDQLKGRLSSPLQYTEWKAENSLDRITAHSNPRDIERVPRGAQFNMEFIYNLANTDFLKQDIENLVCTLHLLQDDYLGGSGSRGYGRINFQISKLTGKKIQYYESDEHQMGKQYKEFLSKSDEEQSVNLEEFKRKLPQILGDLLKFFANK